MEDNNKEISDELYAENVNKISMVMAQLGMSFDSETKEVCGVVSEICSSFVSDEEKSEKSNQIYNLFFEKQIEAYLNGCAYFVNTFKNYCESNSIEIELVDVDTISMSCDKSHDDIIDTTATFLQIISERFDNPNSLDTEEFSFEDRISQVVSLYLETSFIMGLTDAQSLNYFANKARTTFAGSVSKLMDTIFPRVF